MDYLSHNVAVNLKRIRRSRGMSLDLVAEQTGVSKSMLAQIEKDRANPSLCHRCGRKDHGTGSSCRKILSDR